MLRRLDSFHSFAPRRVAPTKPRVSGSRSDKRPSSSAAQLLVPHSLERLLRLRRPDTLSKHPRKLLPAHCKPSIYSAPLGRICDCGMPLTQGDARPGTPGLRLPWADLGCPVGAIPGITNQELYSSNPYNSVHAMSSQEPFWARRKIIFWEVPWPEARQGIARSVRAGPHIAKKRPQVQTTGTNVRWMSGLLMCRSAGPGAVFTPTGA